LSLAGLLLLVHRPSAVADAGFQLSFGATLGIVLLTTRIAARWPRWPLRVETAVAASLAAHVALLPLLVAHFNRVSPAAVVLNLAAVPLSAAVLGAGLLVLPLAAVAPGLAPWMGDVAWMAAHALLRSALAVRAFPWLDLRAPAPRPSTSRPSCSAWRGAPAAPGLCWRWAVRPSSSARRRRRTAACTSRWSTSDRATRSFCSPHTVTPG
jgi:competence protein ComEC